MLDLFRHQSSTCTETRKRSLGGIPRGNRPNYNPLKSAKKLQLFSQAPQGYLRAVQPANISEIYSCRWISVHLIYGDPP